MAGSAVTRALQQRGYGSLLTPGRDALDCLDRTAVEQWMKQMRPNVVVLAAARVGGIHANKSFPADFLLDNLKIQTNVIEAAWANGARRLLFLSSSCIYPKFANQPIHEEALLTGLSSPLMSGMQSPKSAVSSCVRPLLRQHGFDAISLMPTNLYGTGDNYPTKSHVLPALLRRFHEAKIRGDSAVTCWGSGTPLREFLHADDLRSICVRPRALERPSGRCPQKRR